MTAVSDNLWDRYRATHDPGVRTQLLNRYLGLAHRCARDMADRIGNAVEFDDLLGAGTIGLVQALEGFEPARGLAFSTYAVRRIRGAILDELRSRDWRPRSVRTKGRRLAAVSAALTAQTGRKPEPSEVARAMGVDLETYYRMKEDVEGGLTISLAETVARGSDHGLQFEETLADPESGASVEELGRLQTFERLRDAIGALPARERTVLSLYYYEELNLREIAEVLHVTESRISQIRTRALARLRERAVITREDL